MANISKIASEAANSCPPDCIDSEAYESDSSGNHSEHDEINKLEKIRKRIIAGEKIEEINKVGTVSGTLIESANSFKEMSQESSILEQEHLKKSKKVLSKDSDANP